MWPLELLIKSVMGLTVIAADVAIFFVAVRILAMRWPKRPLLALDRVGAALIEAACQTVGRVFHLSSFRARLAVLLILLLFCRMGLVMLLRPMN